MHQRPAAAGPDRSGRCRRQCVVRRQPGVRLGQFLAGGPLGAEGVYDVIVLEAAAEIGRTSVEVTAAAGVEDKRAAKAERAAAAEAPPVEATATPEEPARHAARRSPPRRRRSRPPRRISRRPRRRSTTRRPSQQPGRRRNRPTSRCPATTPPPSPSPMTSSSHRRCPASTRVRTTTTSLQPARRQVPRSPPGGRHAARRRWPPGPRPASRRLIQAWIGPSPSRRTGRGCPVRRAMISAQIEIAVSSGVRAPMSSPIGDISRSRSARRSTPASAQPLHALVVGRAAAHHADVADARWPARPAPPGTSNFGSWVRMHTASRGPSVGAALVEQRSRPVHDDLVGHREPAAGGEDLAGVAHRHAVAEHLGHLGQRGGEVDGAEDPHLRRRRAALDEHAHDRRVRRDPPASSGPAARSGGRPSAPASSSASASRATTRSSSGSPSEPSDVPRPDRRAAWRRGVRPVDHGGQRHRARSARMRVAQRS